MSVTLTIPDSIMQGLRVPEAEAEGRLLMELAVALYAGDLLSFSKAAELAGRDRFLLADILAKRGIPRHYGEEELAEDLQYVRGVST